MTIATEPIGSIPRPPELIEAAIQLSKGELDESAYQEFVDRAVIDTIRRFQASGSPVITDGEQGKPSFATYPLTGLHNLAPDGVIIPFADGHTRRLPRLTGGPFTYAIHADSYLKRARQLTQMPVKQAVISASALSLLYPAAAIPGYSREMFEEDLLNEAEADIRRSLDAGADSVQVDFTEGRLSLKLDPSGNLLQQFIDVNNRVFRRFSPEERARIGVHSCPGGDRDSTHSAFVDYAHLLPKLFSLDVGRFYIQLASEPDRKRVLVAVKQHLRPGQTIFIGVIDPIDPRIETAEDVSRRVLEAVAFLSPEQLGTTDDCGFSPFADDVSTARDVAFSKISARVGELGL